MLPVLHGDPGQILVQRKSPGQLLDPVRLRMKTGLLRIN